MKNRTDTTTPSHHNSGQEVRSVEQSEGAVRTPEPTPGHVGVLQKAKSARGQLIKAMGLAYDPFSSGVSEKDLAPDFGAIYVDVQPGLLSALQRPTPGFLFAEHGMGKTATRIALEYALRLARQPLVLSATYTPSITRQHPAGENVQPHLDDISTELRVDLLVQYIERLPERVAEGHTIPAPAQQRALQRQAQSLPTRFRSAMRAVLADPQGDGAFWRAFRPVVRFVPVTTAWRSLIATLVQASPSGAHRKPSWRETVDDVHNLGFEQIYVLVDAIDEGKHGTDAYLDVIRPLLAICDDLATQQIYLKYFLPIELEGALTMGTDLPRSTLTSLQTIATIDKISPEHLDKLINDRFQAAGTSAESFRSLDWFGEEISESIQARLIEAARGSPRRLIELASALIDFHSLNGFRIDGRLWLTRTEWQLFLEDAERTSLPPA